MLPSAPLPLHLQISELLIQRETLEGEEFESLFEGIPRPEPRSMEPPKGRVSQPEEPIRRLAPAPGLQGSPAPGMASIIDPDGTEIPW